MDFYDLEVWKVAQKLTIDIYQITKKFPRDERFGLTDQLRRASSSIGANIAEGFGRFHFADKNKFYYQARGSIKEVRNFLLLARDLKYIDSMTFNIVWGKAKKGEMLINGVIRSNSQQKRQL